MKPAGRQRVFDLDGGWCHYCGERASTLDHIVPRSAGGPSCQWNLVGSCSPCNSIKSSYRGVCTCFRCIEAERLFAGYTRPSQLPRRRKKKGPLTIVPTRREVDRRKQPTSSLVCPVTLDRQHVRAYSGMGDYCCRCYEVLELPA